MVHIPKTGGSSIQNTFWDLDDPPIFFSIGNFPDGHSPQHSTFSDLKGWNLVPEDFKVISVVRHPYERFCSEFNFQKSFLSYPHDLQHFTQDFFEISGPSEKHYDRHNWSMFSFLSLDGKISEEVEIIDFRHLKEQFKEKTGVTLTKHELISNKFITPSQLSNDIKDIIYFNWREDFHSFDYTK